MFTHLVHTPQIVYLWRLWFVLDVGYVNNPNSLSLPLRASHAWPHSHVQNLQNCLSLGHFNNIECLLSCRHFIETKDHCFCKLFDYSRWSLKEKKLKYLNVRNLINLRNNKVHPWIWKKFLLSASFPVVYKKNK